MANITEIRQELAQLQQAKERVRMLTHSQDYYMMRMFSLLTDAVVELAQSQSSPITAWPFTPSPIDDYEGEQVDCQWDDYPSTDTRIE